MVEKNKSTKVNSGYSFEEANKIVVEYIDVSAARLRQRLVKVWNDQPRSRRKTASHV